MVIHLNRFMVLRFCFSTVYLPTPRRPLSSACPVKRPRGLEGAVLGCPLSRSALHVAPSWRRDERSLVLNEFSVPAAHPRAGLTRDFQPSFGAAGPQMPAFM